jgi:hypothetical protein
MERSLVFRLPPRAAPRRVSGKSGKIPGLACRGAVRRNTIPSGRNRPEEMLLPANIPGYIQIVDQPAALDR